MVLTLLTLHEAFSSPRDNPHEGFSSIHNWTWSQRKNIRRVCPQPHSFRFPGFFSWVRDLQVVFGTENCPKASLRSNDGKFLIHQEFLVIVIVGKRSNLCSVQCPEKGQSGDQKQTHSFICKYVCETHRTFIEHSSILVRTKLESAQWRAFACGHTQHKTRHLHLYFHRSPEVGGSRFRCGGSERRGQPGSAVIDDGRAAPLGPREPHTPVSPPRQPSHRHPSTSNQPLSAPLFVPQTRRFGDFCLTSAREIISERKLGWSCRLDRRDFLPEQGLWCSDCNPGSDPQSGRSRSTKLCSKFFKTPFDPQALLSKVQRS